jgi:hypothetical protein
MVSFFFFGSAVFASEWGKSGKSDFSWAHHSEHPPHDHHNNDHLKFIRMREEKKKKAWN